MNILREGTGVMRDDGEAESAHSLPVSDFSPNFLFVHGDREMPFSHASEIYLSLLLTTPPLPPLSLFFHSPHVQVRVGGCVGAVVFATVNTGCLGSDPVSGISTIPSFLSVCFLCSTGQQLSIELKTNNKHMVIIKYRFPN